MMHSTTHQTAAVSGFIRLFEDAMISACEHSGNQSIFTPILVLDVRAGWFEAFILSMRADDWLYTTSRAVKVEEAPQISASPERTPLCMYRRKSASAWVVCSHDRLNELSNNPDYKTVRNVFDFVSSLDEQKRNRVLDRMLFAYLALVTQTDSNQEYDRVVIVVDEQYLVPMIRESVQRIAQRLNNGQDDRWRESTISFIPSEKDVIPFAFLGNASVSKVAGVHQNFLLVDSLDTVVLYTYEDSRITKRSIQDTLDVAQIDQIIVLHGYHDRSVAQKGIHVVENRADLDRMSLAGYLYTSNMMDVVPEVIAHSNKGTISQKEDRHDFETPCVIQKNKTLAAQKREKNRVRSTFWNFASFAVVIAASVLVVIFTGALHLKNDPLDHITEIALQIPDANVQDRGIHPTDTQTTDAATPASIGLVSTSPASYTLTIVPSDTLTATMTPTSTLTLTATSTQTPSLTHTPTATSTPSATVTSTVTITPTPMLLVIHGQQRVNARACPELSCEVVTAFLPEEQIVSFEIVIGDAVAGNTDWYKVIYNDERLYVHSSLVAQAQ